MNEIEQKLDAAEIACGRRALDGALLDFLNDFICWES